MHSTTEVLFKYARDPRKVTNSSFRPPCELGDSFAIFFRRSTKKKETTRAERVLRVARSTRQSVLATQGIGGKARRDAIMKRRENEVERKPTFNNDSKTSRNEKNAFDKRKHRLKKYSNRYKVDQWQERRKRAVLRGYYKETSKDRCARQKGTETKVETRSGNSDSSGPKKSPSFFDVARKEYERKKEETLRVKAEREEALRKYKERKMQAYKKLSKRTKKGQPVMKDRIELLLQKIQQDKAN